MNKNLIFGVALVLVIGLVMFFGRGGVQKKEVKVGTDVCAEFPKEFIEASIGKKILRTKRFDMTVGTHVCDYYTTENDFLAIHVEDLNFETQKRGVGEFGKTIKQDPLIKMEHFVAWEGNNIYGIYLKLNDNKFVSVDRGTINAATNEESMKLAIAVVDRIQKGENQGLVSASTVEPTKKIETNPVPLPQETDIIRSFVNLIDEGKSSDVVQMMGPKVLNDESNKQAWAVMFNAFESMKIIKIEPSMQSDWTDAIHTYQTTLDVKMKPEAANVMPMPNYGWDNGENIRWISLEKIDNKWTVQGFATGP